MSKKKQKVKWTEWEVKIPKKVMRRLQKVAQHYVNEARRYHEPCDHSIWTSHFDKDHREIITCMKCRKIVTR